MNFLRLKTTHPLYRQGIGETDIVGFDVATEQQDSIGKVVDVLIDEAQRSYYLVVETSSWLSRKSVLLPLSRFQVMPKERRLYLMGISKAEVEKLPAYIARTITADQLPQTAAGTRYEPVSALEASPPLEASLPLEADVLVPVTRRESSVVSATPPVSTTIQELNAPAQIERTVQPVAQPATQPVIQPAIAAEETVRLLEERLVVNRQKRKVGEVIVRKEIETRMVEVPVRRERLIIEQVNPERKQLASIDLHQDLVDLDGDNATLSGVELRDPTSVNGVATTQTIPINLANQVLYKLTQFPQFSNAQVQLTFSDPELQAQYQRWLTERKMP
ncbi:DUF2382 domain-containing protein [Leptolyngbya sp. NK1-12]|uniref:DUF2382 domain-containing protein n=1 Tax=Leptolyngbya sp. NK1-12 TaxID=2547451 RepID=A0AA97AF15_9CYAN|nr:DUF2382 domain-containing protein [Leptolyngbya sp. NK1-12]